MMPSEKFGYEPAKLVVRCLEEEKVNYVFGVPCSENLPVVLALEENERKVKFVVTHDDKNAAIMAGVYGRLQGIPGVCLVSAGPSAHAAYQGIADCHFNHYPVVVLTGGVMRKIRHKNPRAYPGTVELYREITGWSSLVEKVRSIPELLRASFKWSSTMKHAMHLEFPLDVLVSDEDLQDLKPLPRREVLSFNASNENLDQMWKLIREAKRPVFLAGGNVHPGMTSNFRKFIDKAKIPVIVTPSGKGILPMDHECNLFTVGLSHMEYNMKPLLESDLVICLGYNIMEYPPAIWNYDLKKQRKIIHMAIFPSYVDQHYNPDLEVVGNLDWGFEYLFKKMDSGFKPFDIGYIKEYRQKMCDELFRFKDDDARERIKPQKVLLDLRRILGSNDIVVTDAGAHKIWVDSYYQTGELLTCISPNTYGANGCGLPAAIAACLACRDRRVVLIVGDGSFGVSLSELETARRLGVKFTIIVWEDEAFGLAQWKEMMYFGKQIERQGMFHNADVVKIAESFGIKGRSVKDSGQVYNVLKEAIGSNEMNLVSIPIDYNQNKELTERLGGRIFFSV